METNQKPDRTFKRYDEAFKRSAVELLLSSGKSLKQIATELGITTWTLRDWKKRFGPLFQTSLLSAFCAKSCRFRAAAITPGSRNHVVRGKAPMRTCW